jgi:flavin-dependent dehydrogenase
MSTHDIVIVGARAAGSATALLLARMGHDVVVLDRDEFPSDTNSTHQIARTGVIALKRWGLLAPVLESGAPAIRQVMFHSGGESMARTVKDKSGVDLLVAPRRYVLDTLLAQAADRAGAAVRTGVRVNGVHLDDAGRATGVHGLDRDGSPVEISGRFVVGADGLNSRVARSVGAEVIEDRGARGATIYAYFDGPSWPAIEFFVGDRTFAGIFPTHDGQACIWVCAPTEDVRAARRRADSGLQAFHDLVRRGASTLADRLTSARRTSSVRGMLRSPNHLRRAYGPGWALVGDAGYHRDASTGHGISDAFRDAELLAVALDRALRGETEASALADYQSQRDQRLRQVFEITCAMVAYPPAPAFVELTRQLGQAIDAEAAALAAQPVPGEPTLVAA